MPSCFLSAVPSAFPPALPVPPPSRGPSPRRPARILMTLLFEATKTDRFFFGRSVWLGIDGKHLWNIDKNGWIDMNCQRNQTCDENREFKSYVYSFWDTLEWIPPVCWDENCSKIEGWTDKTKGMNLGTINLFPIATNELDAYRFKHCFGSATFGSLNQGTPIFLCDAVDG